MSAREPLPYPHKRTVLPHGRHPFACQCPESNEWVSFEAGPHCPGCRVGAVAWAIRQPDQLVITLDGPNQRMVDQLREKLDDFDPLRVLFERALAERGIA